MFGMTVVLSVAVSLLATAALEVADSVVDARRFAEQRR